MKKIIKYFSLVLFSAFFMFLVASNPVDAIYDREKNNTIVSVNKDEINITVEYQRGIDKNYATYTWCTVNELTGECESYITLEGESSRYTVNYIDAGGDSALSYIALGDATHADNNLTKHTFTIPAFSSDTPKGDKVLSTLNDRKGQTIMLEVDVYYCAIRSESNGEFVGCVYTDNENPNRKVRLTVSVDELLDDKNYMNTEIKDEGIKSMMSKIEDIVNNTVMPILWVVLGLFLMVKGALLGVQIVKSADEPQVRQEKVGALKWLVIGVAIAYAATFVVRVVIGFFENVFK